MALPALRAAVTTKSPCTNELCKNSHTVIHAHYWLFLVVAVDVLAVIIHCCDGGRFEIR